MTESYAQKLAAIGPEPIPHLNGSFTWGAWQRSRAELAEAEIKRLLELINNASTARNEAV